MRRHPPAVKGSGRGAARGVSLVVLVLALALLALPGAPGAGADSGTYVRVAQLAPDMAGATISISPVAGPARDLMLPDEPYGGLSAYQRIDFPGNELLGWDRVVEQDMEHTAVPELFPDRRCDGSAGLARRCDEHRPGQHTTGEGTTLPRPRSHADREKSHVSW